MGDNRSRGSFAALRMTGRGRGAPRARPGVDKPRPLLLHQTGLPVFDLGSGWRQTKANVDSSHSLMSAPAEAAAPRRWYHISLTQQIMLGLVTGVLIGWWINEHFAVKDLDPAVAAAALAAQHPWMEWLGVVRDVFLHLIKVMIAPLIFASVVQGFAGAGDMKKSLRIPGRMLRSRYYNEWRSFPRASP